jgi:hypothetical protein
VPQNDHDNAVRPATAPQAAFLRPKEAVGYLRERYGFGSKSKLAHYRMLDSGPKYHKPNGRTVVYFRDDLDIWVKDLLAATQVTPSSMK